MWTNISVYFIQIYKGNKTALFIKTKKRNKNINLKFMECVKNGMDCEACGIKLQ